MSRMTKFLRQSCSLEQCMRDSNGEPVLNDYGEIQYKLAIIVKCRHEASHKDVQTPDGSIARSTSVYYLDGSFKVSVDDRIDGKVIVSLAEYVNVYGQTEGYEVFV